MTADSTRRDAMAAAAAGFVAGAFGPLSAAQAQQTPTAPEPTNEAPAAPFVSFGKYQSLPTASICLKAMHVCSRSSPMLGVGRWLTW